MVVEVRVRVANVLQRTVGLINVNSDKARLLVMANQTEIWQENFMGWINGSLQETVLWNLCIKTFTLLEDREDVWEPAEDIY
jgi:Na+-transporting NADH:ubiquinone oxidoreductase subunit NqrB